MAVETKQVGQSSLHMPLAKGIESFMYGEMRALVLNNGSESDKTTKKMVRAVEEIANSLHLSLVPNECAPIRHIESGDTFVGTQIAGAKYFMHPRKLASGGELARTIGDQTPEIHLVSGPCLFSVSSVFAVGEDGTVMSVVNPKASIDRPVAEIRVNPELTLYEIEAMLRLSDVICALLHKADHVTQIHINVPRVEYYLYVFDAYENNFLSQARVLNWFDQVDLRHATVANILSKRVKRGMRSGNNATVIQQAPFDVLGDWIREVVNRGDKPQLSEAADILASSSDLWRDILAVRPPKTWRDLDNLSYVYAELCAARNEGDGMVVAVAIENPTESKIHKNAGDIIKHLHAANDVRYYVVGLYPHEYVLPSSGTLYYFHDDPRETRREDVRKILRHRKGENGRV